MTPRTVSGGRARARIVARVREGIQSGEFKIGQFLPPLRELSKAYEAAGETVRRALKQLETEGILLSVPRHGFRVVGQWRQEGQHAPLAFVSGYADMGSAALSTQALIHAFQKAAALRGYSVLAVHNGPESNVDTLVEQLKAAGVAAVLADIGLPEPVSRIRSLGAPVVMVDAWIEGIEVDTVQQDNYRGAYLAARELVLRGAKRIAWLGHVHESAHSRERFAGAQAGLASMGVTPDPKLHVAADWNNVARKTEALISRKNPPDGILALWRDLAVGAQRAINHSNVTKARAITVMGWTVEEMANLSYDPNFGNGYIPPVVLWSARAMAEAALTRLQQLKENPGLPPERILVRTWVRKGSDL